jgi:hypothetical protein
VRDIWLEIIGNQSKKFQILGRHVFSLRELKSGLRGTNPLPLFDKIIDLP